VDDREVVDRGKAPRAAGLLCRNVRGHAPQGRGRLFAFRRSIKSLRISAPTRLPRSISGQKNIAGSASLGNQGQILCTHSWDPFHRHVLAVDNESKMEVIRMAERSAIERIKELDAERAVLFEQAKEEALKKATDAISDLIALGLDYQLIHGAKSAKSTEKVPGTAKDVPCPICGFLTIPLHDRRAHRNQKKKAAFSAAELKEKGLVKV
jgi:hypothetical protein